MNQRALTTIVWVLVAVVLLIGVIRLVTSSPKRSPDQRILIEKSNKK